MIHRAVLQQCLAVGSSLRVAPRTTLSKHQSRYTRPVTQAFPKITTARWFTTEPEIKRATDGEVEVAEQSKPVTTQTELEAKNKEITDLKDKYLRSVADFRNLQDRTKREVQAAKDFAIQKFAKDLTESVDNLERAIAMVPEEKLSTVTVEKTEDRQDLINLYEGLKMTEKILMQTLKKHGLERFDPSVEGVKFNPNEHEATFMTPVEGKEDGSVFYTQVKGFRLNGRILRAAQVGVVKS